MIEEERRRRQKNDDFFLSKFLHTIFEFEAVSLSLFLDRHKVMTDAPFTRWLVVVLSLVNNAVGTKSPSSAPTLVPFVEYSPPPLLHNSTEDVKSNVDSLQQSWLLSLSLVSVRRTHFHRSISHLNHSLTRLAPRLPTSRTAMEQTKMATEVQPQPPRQPGVLLLILWLAPHH